MMVVTLHSRSCPLLAGSLEVGFHLVEVSLGLTKIAGSECLS